MTAASQPDDVATAACVSRIRRLLAQVAVAVTKSQGQYRKELDELHHQCHTAYESAKQEIEAEEQSVLSEVRCSPARHPVVRHSTIAVGCIALCLIGLLID